VNKIDKILAFMEFAFECGRQAVSAETSKITACHMLLSVKENKKTENSREKKSRGRAAVFHMFTGEAC
jgi:hypothetical protein